MGVVGQCGYETETRVKMKRILEMVEGVWRYINVWIPDFWKCQRQTLST
jgi:hypothetical protein